MVLYKADKAAANQTFCKKYITETKEKGREETNVAVPS
jgi:hypothetical protein